VPAPVAFDPTADTEAVAQGVLGKNGQGEVRIRVLVDTLGAADMTTFTVVKSTHPTLTKSVRAAVGEMEVHAGGSEWVQGAAAISTGLRFSPPAVKAGSDDGDDDGSVAR
jgi:hypothetical protein